jgi:hypothetical protein
MEALGVMPGFLESQSLRGTWKSCYTWANSSSRIVLAGVIIIISLLQSTAGHRTLQCLAISLDLRILASISCQPSCANRHSTWPEGVLHYVYAVSTPAVISSTADMAGPLSLYHANTVCMSSSSAY